MMYDDNGLVDLTLTEYQIKVIIDALDDYHGDWLERQERGSDISPRLLKTLNALDEKLRKLV